MMASVITSMSLKDYFPSVKSSLLKVPASIQAIHEILESGRRIYFKDRGAVIEYLLSTEDKSKISIRQESMVFTETVPHELVDELFSIEEDGEDFVLVQNRLLSEEEAFVHKPFIVAFLEECLEKKEPVYMALGKIKYYLKHIKKIEANETPAFGIAYSITTWRARFEGEHLSGTTSTWRTFTSDSDSEWKVEKDENGEWVLSQN